MIFRGRAYRGHDPRWALDPVSGDGARRTGGRFNREGEAALYLACDVATIFAELTQGFGNRLHPLIVCEYDVDCADIADLTNDESCAENGIEPDLLSGYWLQYQRAGRIAPSQAVAAKLRAKGHAGIFVPSFATGASADARNLVLWKWGPDLPHRVTVFDPEQRLPRGRASWK